MHVENKGGDTQIFYFTPEIEKVFSPFVLE